MLCVANEENLNKLYRTELCDVYWGMATNEGIIKCERSKIKLLFNMLNFVHKVKKSNCQNTSRMKLFLKKF